MSEKKQKKLKKRLKLKRAKDRLATVTAEDLAEVAGGDCIPVTIKPSLA